MRRAGVNTGSVYHFFPGKQDVLLAVLTAYRDGIDAMLLTPAWGTIDDPIERVFALLARYRVLIVQNHCTYGCPIGSLALELHEPDPAVRELLAENFQAWTGAVEKNVRAAKLTLPKGGHAQDGGGLRAHHHGGRRHDVAHPPSRPLFRRSRPAAALLLRFTETEVIVTAML